MMQASSKAYRSQGVTVGFVPTMGALHSGHVALLREARLRADIVVCSIFVNPLQFTDPADLEKYPKTFDEDLHACSDAGVDVVFAPRARDMYPPGFDTRLRAGALGAPLEGKSRPGHFDGMLTVVLKLFHAVEPHFAVFGEKDYQQLQLVRRMVSDFHLPIEIVAMPVIRDIDGLALSSRNVRLVGRDRADATALVRALQAAQDVVAEGEHRAKKIEKAARNVLSAVKSCTVDYVACVDPKTLTPQKLVDKPARLLIAARIGSKKKGVRLIDNGPLFPDIGTAKKPKRRDPSPPALPVEPPATTTARQRTAAGKKAATKRRTVKKPARAAKKAVLKTKKASAR
jgi:pantoate--beta-alanine ligase